VITQTRMARKVKPSPHKIQGIRRRVWQGTLDMSLVRPIEQVTDEAVQGYGARGMREEGILCGILWRGNWLRRYALAEEPEMQARTIVVDSARTRESLPGSIAASATLAPKQRCKQIRWRARLCDGRSPWVFTRFPAGLLSKRRR